MRTMKTVFTGIIFLLLLTTFVLSANAEQVVRMRMPPKYSLMYDHTATIQAKLSFDGNTANCKGTILPSDSLDVTIMVSLYKQNGTSWTLLESWTSSSTGGVVASASGARTVGAGTYKVVTTGNVGGLEFPTTSVTKTKP